jgi:RNA polymerase sigma-70 factor (ECF subfamily)
MALVGESHFEPSPTDADASAIPPQDRSLIDACLASAPGAWDAFVGRFAGLLAHVVDRTSVQRNRQLSSADRDDLIAEILVELLKHDAAVLRAFAGRSSLSTYLTVIARRVAVRSMCREFESARQVQAGHDVHPVDRRNGHHELVDREQIEVLLGRLDESEARLVRLHHLESRSYGEISRITGLPIGSIGPALSRVRQKMRETA